MLAKATVALLGLMLCISLLCGFDLSSIEGAEINEEATTVGGIISVNTTWTIENSPYIITATVQIPNGIKLVIEPGVEVKSPYGVEMFLVYGIMEAHGTPNNHIVFDGGGNSGFFTLGINSYQNLSYCLIKDGESLWGSYPSMHRDFNFQNNTVANISLNSYLGNSDNLIIIT